MPETDSRLRGLIADYLLGELDPELKAEVNDMIDRDPEFREIVELSRMLREEASQREAGHPGSELLAAHAMDPRALNPEQLSELEEHLRGCPDCRGDHAQLRKALAPRPLDRLLRNASGRPAWGRIAVAALVLICIVPVWLMILKPGGEILPVSTVDLKGAYRGPEAQLPLAAPAKLFHVSLAHDPWSLCGEDPDPRLEVHLYRDEDPLPIWSKILSANDIRDPSGSGLLLEIPAEGLAEGIYRLEIREGDPPVLGFEDRFQVR